MYVYAVRNWWYNLLFYVYSDLSCDDPLCMHVYIYNEESYVRIEGKVLRLKMSSQEKNDIFSFEAVFSRKSGLQTCC